MASVVPESMPMKYGKTPTKKGGKAARGKKPSPRMPPSPMPMMEAPSPMAPPFRKLASAGRRAAV